MIIILRSQHRRTWRRTVAPSCGVFRPNSSRSPTTPLTSPPNTVAIIFHTVKSGARYKKLREEKEKRVIEKIRKLDTFFTNLKTGKNNLFYIFYKINTFFFKFLMTLSLRLGNLPINWRHPHNILRYNVSQPTLE